MRVYDSQGNTATRATLITDNTLAPVWDQWLEFGVGHWEYMDVQVWDSDLGQDQAMTSAQTFVITEGNHTNLTHYEMSYVYETCQVSSYVAFNYESNKVCSPNPCLNGGTCHSDSLTYFRCECSPGWGGTLCQYRQARLKVYAGYGSKVPNKDNAGDKYNTEEGCESDPYVQVTAYRHSGDSVTKETPPRYDSMNPSWKLWLDFSTNLWYNFTLSVFDYDDESKSELLFSPVTVNPVYGVELSLYGLYVFGETSLSYVKFSYTFN